MLMIQIGNAAVTTVQVGMCPTAAAEVERHHVTYIQWLLCLLSCLQMELQIYVLFIFD